MSCNIYEEPRFNLAERRQADGGERQVCHVDIYESGDGFDDCQGRAAPRSDGAPVQRPFPVNQRNRFRPALLLLVLLSFWLLLLVVILSTLYVGAIKERNLSAQTPSDEFLCQNGGNTFLARNRTVLVGGWTRFRCSCYYRSEEKRTWTESRRLCQDSGGDLVSIGDKHEDGFVKGLNGNRESWIGLYKDATKWASESEWVDGTQFSYRHWREGWVSARNEFKAFIDMEGFWNTANTEPKYWICERNI